MTLNELIDKLQYARHHLVNDDEDPEVLLATQISYPLATNVAEVTVLPFEHPDVPDEDLSVVWIASGSAPDERWPDEAHYSSPYAPRAAWDGS